MIMSGDLVRGTIYPASKESVVVDANKKELYQTKKSCIIGTLFNYVPAGMSQVSCRKVLQKTFDLQTKKRPTLDVIRACLPDVVKASDTSKKRNNVGIRRLCEVILRHLFRLQIQRHWATVRRLSETFLLGYLKNLKTVASILLDQTHHHAKSNATTNLIMSLTLA